MAKYVIDETTLQNLANAIRKVNGETKTYTPTEMIEAVTNIMDSATYILVDESGNEFPAVYVDSERVFTATANDIRKGTVAANNDGIVEGEKEIPSYQTTEGYQIVTAGSALKFKLPADRCKYTKLQAIVCAFNTSLTNSVAAEKVAVYDNLYAVNSTESLAKVTVDITNSTVVLGVNNENSKPCIIRFFTYKEEY